MSECLTAKLKTIYVFTAKLLTLGCNLVLNCLGLGYEEGGGSKGSYRYETNEKTETLTHIWGGYNFTLCFHLLKQFYRMLVIFSGSFAVHFVYWAVPRYYCQA